MDSPFAKWEDLGSTEAADAMGAAMQSILGSGDVAVNLSATSLVANRWLYDGDASSARWIERYVAGWSKRASENGGLIPDNVDRLGVVGGLHDGRWYGGYYGWTWPHGLLSVGMATMIGAANAAMVSGDTAHFDLVRTVLDTVIREGKTATVDETPMSLRPGWLDRLGPESSSPALLVPHRFGRDGWFDYGPMPMSVPTWLWWLTRDPTDWARLEVLIEMSAESPTEVKEFRDKEEAGHEIPWLSFLAGRNPGYPVDALSMALGQVARRMALMAHEEPDLATMHIHFWQRVNPVVTEVLTQLTTGAPQVLYNGGLPDTAVSYSDADSSRPGLPPDVAALVHRIEGTEVELELANLSASTTHQIWVRPGRFGRDDIVTMTAVTDAADYPGPATSYSAPSAAPGTITVDVNAPRVLLELPPSHRVVLTLTTRTSGRPPRYSVS